MDINWDLVEANSKRDDQEFDAHTWIGRADKPDDGGGWPITGTLEEIWLRYGSKLDGKEKRDWDLPRCPWADKPVAVGTDKDGAKLEVRKTGATLLCWAGDHDAHHHHPDNLFDAKNGTTYARWRWASPASNEDRVDAKIYERADGAELGKDLARRIAGVIFDFPKESADPAGFWSYRQGEHPFSQPGEGCWHYYPISALKTLIMETYAGALYGDIESPSTLRLNDGTVSNILRCAVNYLTGKRRYIDQDVFHGHRVVSTIDRRWEIPDATPTRPTREHYLLADHELPYRMGNVMGPPEMFLRFLETTFGGQTCQDIKERIDFVQEWLGLVLMRQATAYKNHLWIVGPPDSGKSTLLKVLRHLIPEDLRVSIPPHKFGQQFGLDGLQHAVINIVSEADEDRLRKLATAKAITSADAIQVDIKHRDPVTIVPTAGHLVVSNTLPSFNDSSGAWERRWTVIRLPGSIPIGEQIEHLDEKIAEEEAASILRWALDGFARVQERGKLTQVPSSEYEKSNWRAASDSAAAWMTDRLGPPDESVWTSKKDLYSDYCEWCEEWGRSPLGSRKLSRRIESEGYAKLRRSPGVGFFVDFLDPETDEEYDARVKAKISTALKRQDTTTLAQLLPDHEALAVELLTGKAPGYRDGKDDLPVSLDIDFD